MTADEKWRRLRAWLDDRVDYDYGPGAGVVCNEYAKTLCQMDALDAEGQPAQVRCLSCGATWPNDGETQHDCDPDALAQARREAFEAGYRAGADDVFATWPLEPDDVADAFAAWERERGER